MRTKSVVIVLLVAIAVFLSSCGNSAKPNAVVKNIPLTNDLKTAQSMYGSFLTHFQVPKNEIHDLHIYLYQNGVRKEIISTLNSPASDRDDDIYIADKTISDSATPNRAWIINDNGGISSGYVSYLKELSSIAMTQGLGKTDFVMQKGKSYILAYEAFTSKNTIGVSTFSDLSDQSAFEQALNQGKYSDYPYIYLITINLSQGKK